MKDALQQLLRIFAPVLVALLTFLSFGCSKLDVRESSADTTRLAIPTPYLATPLPELHDVVVTAVDFDPLPRPDKPLDAEKSSFLAIIENKGNKTESQLAVSAVLRSDKDENPLFQSRSQIERLAPGESRVVRFEKLGSIPLLPAYVLHVEVAPVTGEARIDNNTKSYRIEVALTSR